MSVHGLEGPGMLSGVLVWSQVRGQGRPLDDDRIQEAHQIGFYI